MRLMEICELIVDCPHSTAPDEGKGYPLIRTPNIGKGRLLLDNVHKVSEEVYIERNKRATPRENDLILAREAPVGNIAIIKKGQNVCLGQRTVLIRPNKEKVNPNYLVYYLLSPRMQTRLLRASNGATVNHLNMVDIKKLEIELPDIKIQNKVGKLLPLVDDKVEKNRKINKNLFEMVNAYYTSLFKDVECEMTTIGNYTERIYSGGTPTTSNVAYWGGGFGWFSSGETRNRFVISTDKTITQSGIDNSSTKLAAKYDIVMASAGQGFTRGQTSMLLIDAYVNQSVIVIHADRNIIPYLFWNLANRYEELRAISDSSSIRGSLTTKMIAAFEIPLANGKTIQNFSEFAWAVIPQIENNLLENERLAALRDSLLPKLMSGELDISNLDL